MVKKRATSEQIILKLREYRGFGWSRREYFVGLPSGPGVVDEWTRKSLAIVVGRSFVALDVLSYLAELFLSVISSHSTASSRLSFCLWRFSILWLRRRY